MLEHLAKAASTSAILIAAATALSVRPALAQQAPRDCRVRKEPSGLVRGDRLPKGCVLVNEDEPSRWRRPQRRTRAVWHPCESFSERFFYTPNVKKTVLKNSARLCPQGITGRVPAPASGPGAAGRASPPKRVFGPLQRPMGPVQRPFGSFQRTFGSGSRPRPSTPVTSDGSGR